jgi:hypothetical protein
VFDLPWNFVEAWQTACTIINWQDNLSEDDMPERKIWHDSEKLKSHFENVKKRWKGDESYQFPEGSREDADLGMNVTLRNQFMKSVEASLAADDDFMRI